MLSVCESPEQFFRETDFDFEHMVVEKIKKIIK